MKIQLVFSIVQLLPFNAHADVAVTTSSLKNEIDAPIGELTVAYSLFDEPVEEIKSPTLAACIRKQLLEYKKATESFEGGTTAFADTLKKKGAWMTLRFFDLSREKSAGTTSFSSIGLTPYDAASRYKTILIQAALGVDPGSHRVVCQLQSADQISNSLLDIKSLGLKAKASLSQSTETKGVH